MAHDLEAQLRRLYDGINTGDFALFDELVADDFVEHEELPGMTANGKEDVKAFFQLMRSGFPDLRFDVEDMVVAGDVGVVRARMRGTHQGEFMGIPATGNALDVPLIDWLRFRGGQVAEHWGVMDSGAMMGQLGVEAPPA